MNFDKSTFGSYSSALQAFAISQLDPFHDTPYRLEGAPSDASADSVVLVLNQEKMVTAATFGLPTTAGDKWDLHVAILPILQQASFYQARLQESVRLAGTPLSGTESDVTTLYPISAYGCVSGNKTFSAYSGDTDPVGISPNISGFFSNTTSTIFVPRTLRCIGVSFEVVDETPKMYQQGSVTVYCKPSNRVDNFRASATFQYASSTRNISLIAKEVSCPPNDIKAATIIPNSRTWKAQEGAYVVGRCFSSDNPFGRCGTSDVLFYNPVDPDDDTLYNSYLPGEACRQGIDSSTLTNADSFNASIPYNISGAYFTGLSNQYGTYRIRSKFIYEILPDPTDSSLIPLATQTVPREPEFERLLWKTVSMLPPGVPQTWNPKGEFWKLVGSIAKQAKKYVQPAADIASKLIAGDAPGALISSGQLAARVLTDHNERKKKKKLVAKNARANQQMKPKSSKVGKSEF